MSKDYMDEFDRVCHDWASEERDGVARFRIVFEPSDVVAINETYMEKREPHKRVYLDNKVADRSE